MMFFLAASFDDKQHMREIRVRLEDQGHEVNSDWIDQDGAGLTVEDMQADPDTAMSAAFQDYTAIREADITAVFTGVPSTTGGFQVEFGIALGLDKPVILVGPTLNIFMTIPSIRRYDSDEDFLEFTSRARFNFGVLQES